MRLNNINILILSLVCISCGHSFNSEDGYELEEFAFIDKTCDSIARDYVEHIANNKDFADCLVMELNNIDGEYVYLLSHHSKDKVMSYFIQYLNKRIVGFVDYDGQIIILLTDMDEIIDFKNCFKSILKPLNHSKRFKYICHQTYLCYDKQNLKENNWSHLELIYDPLFLVYKKKNGKWSSPFFSTNPNVSENATK